MPYQGSPNISSIIQFSTPPPIKIGIIIKKDYDQHMSADNDLIQLVISQ